MRPAPLAAPWPEADRLFHRDPRWLGGDAAISIALPQQRVLWLFGDSFVAPAASAGGSRRGAAFVRNSVALQQGRDPSRAELRFYAGTGADGAPASFFTGEDGAWYWPGHGLLLDGALTVFLERMQADPSPGGLGFRNAGWTAVRIDDPEAEPSVWRPVALPTPDTGALGLVGVSVLLEGDYVYAYAVREPGDHAIMLLRWTRADFARGALMKPQYWLGAGRGFGSGPPAVVLAEGAAELSVSADPSGGYFEVQSRGFGAAPIVLRRSAALVGPFGAPIELLPAPRTAPPDLLLYAGRAHPELQGAELIVTYATNSLDQQRLMRDSALYYPRFLRARLP